MAEHLLCIDCHERPARPGRRRCQPCSWAHEKPGRDVQRRQAAERDYKRRLRAQRGCRTRAEIKAAAIERAQRREQERAAKVRAPRPPRPSTFVTTDTLKKPLVERARNVVWAAISRGRIEKPTRCTRCGCEPPRHRMHAHHPDHTKPLEVQWLCSRCHSEVDPNYSPRRRSRRHREGQPSQGACHENEKRVL